jgi:hypothetical protein
MKEKIKSNAPKRKGMKREGRIKAAKYWIPRYEGKNIIKGYSKYFGVNKLCAIKELEMLGYNFKPEYIMQVKESLKAQERLKQEHKLRKKQSESLNDYIDYNETFYFIAGYTSGGTPYGVTREEVVNDGLIEESKLINYIEEISF